MTEGSPHRASRGGKRPGDLIIGIGPVLEALRAERRRVRRIWLAAGRGRDRRTGEIRTLAGSRGVVLVEADSRELARLGGSGSHQGVIAAADPLIQPSLEVLLQETGSQGLLVVLDQVQDPQNLGAVLRSAESAGADGVIVPRDRAARLTSAAIKVAEGAAEYVPVVEVTNLTRALDAVKRAGFLACALEPGGQRALTEVDLTGPTALVLGSEGSGLRRLVRETCDVIVSLPVRGRIGSLNVAAAAAVAMFEAVRQRSADAPRGGTRLA